MKLVHQLSLPVLRKKYNSPLGQLILSLNTNAVVGLDFPDDSQDRDVQEDFGVVDSGIVEDEPELVSLVKEQLDAYFASRLHTFDLPIQFIHGTPFQQSVWQTLLSIPFGTAISYKVLAQRVGSPAAVRAVGGANGKNPIPLIVPCHRVINHSGRLGGYSGGLQIKRWLLDHEQISYLE